MKRYPHEFSGGQRQRIGIARALILRLKLVVADEPVSALDVSVGAQVLLLLQELQNEFGLTYIFISHSLPVVAQVATRIAVMRAGQFVEVSAAQQVLHQPAHAYTRELLQAVPTLPARWVVDLFGHTKPLPSQGAVLGSDNLSAGVGAWELSQPLVPPGFLQKCSF